MALSELSNPEDWAEEGWSQAAVPLLAGKALTGVLACYALGNPGAPIAASPEFSAVATLLAGALERALAPEPSPESGEASRVRTRDAVFEYANLVGASPAMRLIYEEIAQVARTNATTLIRGESGTGKELVACAIHNNSERAAQPLDQGQLRRPARTAASSPSCSVTNGRVHRRPRPPPRPLRARRRGHAVSR